MGSKDNTHSVSSGVPWDRGRCQPSFLTAGGWLLPGTSALCPPAAPHPQFGGPLSLPPTHSCERYPALRSHRPAPYPSPYTHRNSPPSKSRAHGRGGAGDLGVLQGDGGPKGRWGAGKTAAGEASAGPGGERTRWTHPSQACGEGTSIPILGQEPCASASEGAAVPPHPASHTLRPGLGSPQPPQGVWGGRPSAPPACSESRVWGQGGKAVRFSLSKRRVLR